MPPRARRIWCRLPTCSSSSDINPELQFFSFPSSRYKQLKWLEAVGIPEWRLLSLRQLHHYHLCSLHFDNRFLRNSAIPSLLLFPDPDDIISEEDFYLLSAEEKGFMPEHTAPRCANCSNFMVTRGKFPPEETTSVWRQESNGIRIVKNNPSAPDSKTGLSSAQQPKALDMSIPAVLNSILKLPTPNRITKDIRMCADCAPVLAKIVALFDLLQKMSNPKSTLNTAVFKDLEEIHGLVLDRRDLLLWKKFREAKGDWSARDKYLKPKAPVQRPPPTPRTSKLVVKPWPTEPPVPDPEPLLPVIVKTESLTVTPGFIHLPATEAVTEIIPTCSEPVEEPMEEDPLAIPPPPTAALDPDLQVRIKPPAEKLKTPRKRSQRLIVKQRRRKLAEQGHPDKIAGKNLQTRSESSEASRRKVSAEEARRRKYEIRKIYVHPPCPHCGRVLKERLNKHALDMHIKSMHTFNSRFTCEICARPFPNPKTLRKHKLTHMNEEERSEAGFNALLCPACGKKLKSEGCLKQHLKTHTDPESRQLRCPEENCDFTTLCSSTLKRHARFHDPNTETPFKCTKCGAAFKASQQLKYHSMQDCAPPDRIHVCDLPGCGKRFKLKQQLVLHYVSQIHGLSAEEAREKVYPGLPCPDWVEAQISKRTRR